MGGDFLPVQTGPGAQQASCKMGTVSFPGDKVRPGYAADHSPSSSAEVMEEKSCTSTHPLGHNRACNGVTLLLVVVVVVVVVVVAVVVVVVVSLGFK